MTEYDLGTATLTPLRDFIAGEFTTLTYTYTSGHPIDDTGFIKIVFRYAGDFGIPQFTEPQLPNFCTVSTSGNCRIQARWDPKGHTRPWGFALYLKVMGGFLNSGDQVSVIFGDRSQGSPGWQMQTFSEDSLEFKTFVDPIATYQFKELPVSPTISVIPGAAAKAVCIAPSQVSLNAPFTYYLKVEDRWGNPVHKPKPHNHPGFSSSGIHYITAQNQECGLSATSNPIMVFDQQAGLNHYWADFHGQSEETIGSNSIESYFSFAKDFALLDIAAHQGNDFQITDEFWDRIKQITSEYDQPHHFVTFPGYEWSGNTPLGGDRNIYFCSEVGYITRSSNELLPDQVSQYPLSSTADELFANLKTQKGSEPFAFAHVGGRYADLSMHDPEIELAVEIHSDWGTFEWLLHDALSQGYKIAVVANSDGHKGRPGASYPGASKFGSYGGLTCVLSKQLDRQHIKNALASRHCYATTGNRIHLDLALVQGKTPIAIMGDEITVNNEQQLSLDMNIAGTAPIEKVDIYNGQNKIKTLRPYANKFSESRIKLIWGGAEVRGRDRKVNWDGELHLTSNSIQKITPINFWNPDQQPRILDARTVRWNSITTGGITGLILNVIDSNAGSLRFTSTQGNIELPIASINTEPHIYEFGGIKKHLQIYRLPDVLDSLSYNFQHQLSELEEGVNPIYIRITQEDGNMAWSSPIYLKTTIN